MTIKSIFLQPDCCVKFRGASGRAQLQVILKIGKRNNNDNHFTACRTSQRSGRLEDGAVAVPQLCAIAPPPPCSSPPTSPPPPSPRATPTPTAPSTPSRCTGRAPQLRDWCPRGSRPVRLLVIKAVRAVPKSLSMVSTTVISYFIQHLDVTTIHFKATIYRLFYEQSMSVSLSLI